jgi:GxxExxY protein
MTQRDTGEMFRALSERENWLGGEIRYIAFKIHMALGPGLLESVYQKCFCYELSKREISFTCQQPVSIVYDDMLIEDGLRLDLNIDNLVIVELKAQDNYHPVWEAQLLSYLKLTDKRLGYLINFHVPLMKDGIKRRIL